MLFRQFATSSPRAVAAIKPVILTGLLTLSAFGAAAYASVSTPTLVVAGKAVATQAAPFVDGGNFYASPDFVRSMGADYSVSADGRSVTITSSGSSTSFPCRQVSGQPMVQVADVAQELGGVYAWNPSSRTATILARIQMVREDSDQLSVVTSFPVSYHVDSVNRPNRVYIDVQGASLGAGSTTIPVSGDDVAAVRANQMLPTTVRVVVDLKRRLGYHVATAADQRRVDVRLVDGAGNSGAALAHTASDVTDPSQTPSDNGGSTDPSQATPLNPTGMQLQRSDATQHVIDIKQFAGTPGTLQVDVVVAGGNSSKPAPYHVFMVQDPNRLVFDLPGADFNLSGSLAASTDCSLPMTNAMVKSIRWGEPKQDTVATSRVVFDLYKPFSYTVSSYPTSDGNTCYAVDLLLNAPLQPQSPTLNNSTAPGVPAAPAAPPTVTPMQPNAGDPSSDAGSPPPAPVISQGDDVPGNILSGKTIVVDPGHGGKDGGAPGLNGIWEKDIVLAIGKQLRDQLVACGAKVIMTRDDDTFIPLPDRSAMGVENHADFFVSVHADSSGGQNSHEGTTVYYHANLASCRSLASSIADRLGQLNDGITADGVRSDYVRFPGVGFSVLRRSPETAVLVETGYVNDDQDAGVLTNAASQKLIAEGIVAGLKDYAAHSGGASEARGPGRNTTVALGDSGRRRNDN